MFNDSSFLGFFFFFNSHSSTCIYMKWNYSFYFWSLFRPMRIKHIKSDRNKSKKYIYSVNDKSVSKCQIVCGGL